MSTRTKTTHPRTKPAAPRASAGVPSDDRDLTPILNHPLAPLFGVFADNPAFDELMEEVWKRRDREHKEGACEE